jgi:hypothetical protein
LTKPKTNLTPPLIRANESVSAMYIITDSEEAFSSTIDLVEDYLNNGMLVPTFLLRNMIAGVRARQTNLSTLDRELAFKQAEFVLEKLGKLPFYNFKWKFKSDFEGNTGVVFNLLQFSRISLLAYIGYKKDNPHASKRHCVEFFYQLILDEVLPYLDENIRQTINKYRIQVLVGTLTIAAGYKRNYPNKYTIKEIKGHVQHLMKKMDEKNSIGKRG